MPLRALAVSTQVRREGRRIQLVDVEVVDEEEGRLACRARCMRQRIGDVPLPDDAELAPVLALPPPPPGPDGRGTEVLRVGGDRPTGPVPFACGGAPTDRRFTRHARARRRLDPPDDRRGRGRAGHADPASGRRRRLRQRALARPRLPPLPLRQHRPHDRDAAATVGEWICLDSRTEHSTAGSGLSSTVLFDEGGFLGRSLQSLFVDRR